MTDILNQSNYLDSQNFDVDNLDMVKFYNTFMSVIDGLRSMSSILKNTDMFDDLNIDTYQTINSKIKPESAAQESRCHAFFRWIGFPVIAEDKLKFYNPGHCINSLNKNITIETRLEIANSIDDKFGKLSLKRELYSNRILNAFSIPNSINASALSLLSGANIRKFSDHFQNIDPFDFESKNQQYKIDTQQIVGRNIGIELSSFADVDGNMPSGYSADVIKKQAHYIKPFIVDPRIDFCVSPSYNKIGVPFVPDNSFLRDAEGKSVRRPLLEKIIRERFSVSNSQSSMGTNQKANINYIKTTDTIKDEDLLKIVGKMIGNLEFAEQNQFTYFLNLARIMMKKLIEAQNLIKKAQSHYYWLPISGTIGPETGCTVQPVLVSNVFYNTRKNLITASDRVLATSFVKVELNKNSVAGNSAEGVTEVLDFGLSNDDHIDPKSSKHLGDLAEKNLTQLNKLRSKQLDKAGQALQTVELIMGEYGGLGLCDIVAVFSALYLMPKEYLLGFLDIDAFSRMKIALNIDPGTQKSIINSQKILNVYVSNFYYLMDKLYDDQKKIVGS
jgi:hypothetical protein